ncbi:MAG: DUF971 domain-containing protein [Candidatus Omnitrophica bacterium]|nr:DUF971 domain-containing protein [Candidatus Omnitrophota bacterium]
MGKTAFDPERIERMGEEGLKIRWADGHESLYAWVGLRSHCPCAACRENPQGVPNLKPGSLPLAAVKPFTIQPVGRYALTIQFGDGHKTGIFSFEYLRSLCRCEACAPRQFTEG